MTENFEKSEKGKKLAKSEKWQNTKKIGKAGVHVIAEFYSGMYQALFIMGHGVQEATTGIVKHKYGDQVGNVVNNSNSLPFLFLIISSV